MCQALLTLALSRLPSWGVVRRLQGRAGWEDVCKWPRAEAMQSGEVTHPESQGGSPAESRPGWPQSRHTTYSLRESTVWISRHNPGSLPSTGHPIPARASAPTVVQAETSGSPGLLRPSQGQTDPIGEGHLYPLQSSPCLPLSELTVLLQFQNIQQNHLGTRLERGG